MTAAAVDPIQDILDNHSDMADFLEIEAQVDDPEQRARIITKWLLGSTGVTEQVARVRGEGLQGAETSERQQSSISSFSLHGVCSMQVDPLLFLHQHCAETLGLHDINQDRLDRIQEWFDTKKEAKDDNAVAKFTDSCIKRDWVESIRTHHQRKLNTKRLPTTYVLRPEPDPMVVVVDQGWGNPSFDKELFERG